MEKEEVIMEKEEVMESSLGVGFDSSQSYQALPALLLACPRHVSPSSRRLSPPFPTSAIKTEINESEWF